jgi:hypothetical protein
MVLYFAPIWFEHSVHSISAHTQQFPPHPCFIDKHHQEGPLLLGWPSFAKRVPREYLAEEPSSSNDDDSRKVYEWSLTFNGITREKSSGGGSDGSLAAVAEALQRRLSTVVAATAAAWQQQQGGIMIATVAATALRRQWHLGNVREA